MYRTRSANEQRRAHERRRPPEDWVCPTCAQMKKQLRWWRERGWVDARKKRDAKHPKEDILVNRRTTFYGIVRGESDIQVSGALDVTGSSTGARKSEADTQTGEPNI